MVAVELTETCRGVVVPGGAVTAPARWTVEPAPVTDPGPLPDGKDANQLLEQAIQAFLPEVVPWQRAQIWQRFLTETGSRVVQGRYLIGPDCRLRLELM